MIRSAVIFASVITVFILAHDSARGQKGKSSTRQKTVTVNFATSPGDSGAVVHYGKRILGTVPFSHTFAYDSGPIDVTFRAPGFYPVHTRAFTTKSYLLRVVMTPLGEAQDLLGYRRKIEADAGVDAEDTPKPTAEKSTTP